MVYTFSCPDPCRRVISIDAYTDEEAAELLIKAGALTCRNRRSRSFCDSTHLVMPPLPDEQLREAVRFYMHEENLPEGNRGTY